MYRSAYRPLAPKIGSEPPAQSRGLEDNRNKRSSTACSECKQRRIKVLKHFKAHTNPHFYELAPLLSLVLALFYLLPVYGSTFVLTYSVFNSVVLMAPALPAPNAHFTAENASSTRNRISVERWPASKS
jgi:hypothetical protein